MDKIKSLLSILFPVIITVFSAHVVLWVYFMEFNRDGNALTVKQIIHRSVEDIEQHKEYPMKRVDFAALEDHLRASDVPTNRVFCIGDSWTYGIMVGENESYPAQLQKYLPDHQVINLGNPGLTSADAVKVTQQFSPYFKRGDIVVLLVGMNDLASDFAVWRQSRGASRQELFLSSYPWAAFFKLISITLRYRLDEMGVKKEQFQKNIEIIAHAVRSQGSSLLLLTYALPHNTDLRIFDPHDKISRKYLIIDEIIEVGQKLKVRTIDLRSVFDGRADKNNYFLNIYYPHLNQKGYSVLVEQLVPEIQILLTPAASNKS
ncbi:MAG: SGNH/GDSL hydrolase family protein [Candidatus Omnitrophica bacterium]|nr:SGNH/GDSL hydrolase family protein [Candidatus Omnitrophota bacterium]